jgi:hypothetical protein
LKEIIQYMNIFEQNKRNKRTLNVQIQQKLQEKFR